MNSVREAQRPNESEADFLKRELEHWKDVQERVEKVRKVEQMIEERFGESRRRRR